MKKYKYPNKENWEILSQRPIFKREELEKTVKEILTTVKNGGDNALLKYTAKFDKAELTSLAASQAEIEAAINTAANDLKKAIQTAKANITKFHAAQKEKKQIIETTKGVRCWRKSVGIEKVGLYIPGGTAPLFSTILMLGIPAKLAGCQEIILCTPPNLEGEINPAILYTANLVGITKIYKVGGAQAIAAMTYGTETIPQVYKIFGPGNQYVTKAKELIQQEGTAIDMPAGPSEVLVIADETSVPAFVAADLLSQAEHGADSQVILLSDNEEVIEATKIEVTKQLAELPRKNIAAKALGNSRFILLKDMTECFAFSNQYAPEHLIIASEKAMNYVDKIVNAGSVFLGNYSCESAGDYASGTNHTLPTNGFAKNYSGVSLDSFVKKITFQQISKEGIQNLGGAIEKMAEAEQLVAHKNAVSIRLQAIDNEPSIVKGQAKQLPIVRANIQKLVAYSSARDEFKGKEGLFLDANENPYGVLNRYPDPQQRLLKKYLGAYKKIAPENIFIGNGSDEVIDLAFRIFCNPGVDKALTFAPSYGMYDVSAAINDVELLKIPLNENFDIDVASVAPYLTDETLKIIFICSPNNPTGNVFNKEAVTYILENFRGIVIIDEAYVDFSDKPSWSLKINDYPNLIVSQTFSKAWGLAGVRVGAGYMNTELLGLFNKVKPPYNVSELNQGEALSALGRIDDFEYFKKEILKNRATLINGLKQVPCVKKVYPTDANFVLIEVTDAPEIYKKLVEQKVIIRNRHKLVDNCLRITVGTQKEILKFLIAIAKL